jgi:glycosyltransferase involved in cell wall biosynthesis
MKGPLRVLHVIDTLEGGGSQRWLWDIVRLSQSDTQHRVIAVFPDTGADTYATRLETLGVYVRRSWPRSLKAMHVALHGPNRIKPGVRRKAVGAAWLGWSLAIAVTEVIQDVRRFKPNAIHAHGFFGYAIGVAVAWVSRRGVVHTVPCLMAQMVDANATWLPWLYRRSHPIVHKFFTNMPAEQRALGIPDRKLFVIPGAVDLEAAAAVERDRGGHRARVRASLGIPNAAFVLISVGRLHPSKGHAHAISTLALLAGDEHLIVLGEGRSLDDLTAQARTLGVIDRVHFAGYREDVLEHYAAADLFMRVMVFEGDNMSSLLAMAMRLPVVAFATGAESDLLPSVGHGLSVPVGDDEALAQAVRTLQRDPALRSELAEKGGAFASNELDVHRTITAYQGFYREASNRRDE